MREYKFRGLNHNNTWVYGMPNLYATQGKNGVMWSDAEYCYQFDIDTLEIIGNQYENPELLEQING